MIQGSYFAPLGHVGLYLIIVCPFYVSSGKQINMPRSDPALVYILHDLVCLRKILIFTSNDLPFQSGIQYIRRHRIKHYAKSLWRCYGLCPSCDLPCFLDGQLWDITVTIKKKMKWQEHPLVCMHAKEWTTLSLRVRLCLSHIHAHKSFNLNSRVVFMATGKQRQACVNRATKTVTGV